MPSKYSIHPDQNLIRQTLWGAVTATDLRNLAAATWADPTHRKKLDILADLRDAQLHIPYDQMVEYTQFLSGQSEIGRQAIVVSRQLEFGMARMYEQLTEHRVLREGLRVFFSMEEAEKWLAQDRRDATKPPSS
ncbi:STAS/SEC14 domain-containing protein [Povalibacter sp.]|uniref:STAS/SEC14 domain-containing protein n=1 Tax=Povalibacter sp. TaxID=1962978 RepID=UPI002F4282BE